MIEIRNDGKGKPCGIEVNAEGSIGDWHKSGDFQIWSCGDNRTKAIADLRSAIAMMINLSLPQTKML